MSQRLLKTGAAIQNEEPSGAAVNVIRSYGANYAASVDISDFS